MAAACPWVSPPIAQSKGFTKCTCCHPTTSGSFLLQAGNPPVGTKYFSSPSGPLRPSACLPSRPTPTDPQEDVSLSPPCCPVPPTSPTLCLLWEPILPGPSMGCLGRERSSGQQTVEPHGRQEHPFRVPSLPCTGQETHPLPLSPEVTPAPRPAVKGRLGPAPQPLLTLVLSFPPLLQASPPPDTSPHFSRFSVHMLTLHSFSAPHSSRSHSPSHLFPLPVLRATDLKHRPPA